MPDADIERRLRAAGERFVEAHDETETAIREAADTGMRPDEISRVSGLSAATVSAFLRAAHSD